MKKAISLVLVAVTLTFVAFAAGWEMARRDQRDLITGVAAHNLANTLLTLRFMENGDVGQAKRMLQAGTNGELSWIVGLSQAEQPDQNYCPVLNTLKDYRQKRKLFVTEDWEDLWRLPGSREEESRRQAFLSSMKCGSARLFTVD